MVKSDFPQLGSKQARQELEVTSHGQESKEKAWQEAWPAAVLSGKVWTQWWNHILKTSTTWLYVVVTHTHALCARVSEVLKLRASDFHWSGKTVTIAALKRQPQARLKKTSMFVMHLGSFNFCKGI
jgi:hypothetical protein